jgi:hypothetical protein
LGKAFERHGIGNKVGKTAKNNDFQEFEIEFVKREKVNIIRNFHIVDALYNEAVALGVIPLKNPLEGIEVDLKIARVVNSV